MKALVTGAAVIGLDSFTDFYPRAQKEINLAGVTHVFPLAAQAGVRNSWRRDFHVYTVNNVDATRILLEACIRKPIERTSTRRVHPFTATASSSRCARTRGPGRCPLTA